MVDYGAIIYGVAPNSLLNTLNPINNQGIRLSIGAFKTSPIPSILCEANTPPLDIRRNMLTHRFVIKRLADKENTISTYLFTYLPCLTHLKNNQPISTRLKRWLDTTNTKLPKLLPPVSYKYPQWKLEININTSMIQELEKENIESSKVPQKFTDIIRNNFQNHKIIYTDGSKSNDQSGFVIISDEEIFKFSLLEYIFTIEALAILTSLELIEQHWKNT